jgi:aryl-alcohol dehydrogenase-like predicted oxidoreductase
MEYHNLGRTGLRVSDIGFGAMTIGGEIFGATDDNESLRALNRALDLGMNFIDTADAYGRGHSEELIAQLLKTRRQEVVLATKGGNQFTVRQGLRNFDPEYITAALEQSLKRLQIETIDLYQLHNPSQEVMRRGEIFDRLERLKREGKIRFYGVSIEQTDDGIVAVRDRQTGYAPGRVQHPASRPRGAAFPSRRAGKYRHHRASTAGARGTLGSVPKRGRICRQGLAERRLCGRSIGASQRRRCEAAISGQG